MAGMMSNGMQPAGKVLIFGDDFHELESITRALSQAGYEIVRSGSAREALRMAREEAADPMRMETPNPELPAGERPQPVAMSLVAVAKEAEAGPTHAWPTADDRKNDPEGVYEALKDQATLLANAQRIGRMGIWDMNLRTGKLTWSEATCALFGIKPEEFGGSSEAFFAFILPEDRPRLIAAHTHSLANLGCIEAEYRIRRPDGEVRWMHERGDVERDTTGQPVRRLGVVMDITERKHVEEERQRLLLCEQAARAEADRASHYYRSLFESAPGCYLVLTPDDFTILAISDAFLNATMTRREQLYGRCIFDAFPDDPSEPDADGVRNLRASLESVKAERRSNVMAVQRYPIRRPEEEGGGFEERFWSPVNSPVFGPHGELAYIIHRVEDVTEYMHLKRAQNREEDAVITLERRAVQMEADIVLRNMELKRANEQLARSEAMLRMASHLSQLGGWALELQGMKMTWSDEVRAIHEVPPDYEPTVEDGIAFYAPEYRERIIAAVQACIAEGTPYDVESVIVTRKGQRVWVRSVGDAVRDASGHIVRLQGAFQDISRRKRAEQSVRESEERFRLLSRATNDAIWDWNLVANTLWWNEGFESLFGVRRDEVDISVESWTSRIHPEDRDRVLADMRRAIDGDIERWSGRYRFQRHDGGYAHVLDRGHVIRDASGKAVRMVGGMTDITERLELAEQLRQSQRLESVGQLTGGVAHDFNNLLTVILGGADLLQGQLNHDGHSRLHAEMIERAARRGADLTRHLLAFARKQALNPRAVHINQLVNAMNDLLRRTLGEHIDIQVEGDEDLWPALVDPGQLESALLNLAINARDAMPGGGLLTIQSANVWLDEAQAKLLGDVLPGPYIQLSVSDTGMGIRPEHLDRVFEPFFTTKEKGKGTGLGLAMVYGFIKQSGGHVQLESQPGHGTAVKLYLPPVDGMQRPSRPVEREASVEGGSEAILLVEDDDLVRQCVSDQLALLGYHVMEARNGPEALSLLQTGVQVDLLFTDIVMPGGMTGRQLAEDARQLRPDLQVLFTSGYTEDAFGNHDRLDPGVRLLSKPYRQADLARAIRKALTAPA